MKKGQKVKCQNCKLSLNEGERTHFCSSNSAIFSAARVSSGFARALASGVALARASCERTSCSEAEDSSELIVKAVERKE